MSDFARTLSPASHNRPFRFDAADFNLGSSEMFFMRLGFAVLLFFTIKWEAGNLGTVKPKDAVGLAKFVDLTFFARIEVGKTSRPKSR